MRRKTALPNVEITIKWRPRLLYDVEGVSSQRRSRFERATRSLATFVRSHRSLRSLAPQRSASLHLLRSLAPCTGLLTHFAHIPRGTVEILEYVFTLLSRFTGTNAFMALTRNTPRVDNCSEPLLTYARIDSHMLTNVHRCFWTRPRRHLRNGAIWEMVTDGFSNSHRES